MTLGRKNETDAAKGKGKPTRNSSKPLPPVRLYYSFADALRIIQSSLPHCTADYLLYCGLMGRISFFVHVPSQYDVVAYDTVRRTAYRVPVSPRLMVVDSLDCGNIEWGKKTSQSSFHSGYVFNGTHLNQILPTTPQSWSALGIVWKIIEPVPLATTSGSVTNPTPEINAPLKDSPSIRNTPDGSNYNFSLIEIAPNQIKSIELTVSEKNLFATHEGIIRLIELECWLTSAMESFAAVPDKSQENYESLYQKTLKAGKQASSQYETQPSKFNRPSPSLYFSLQEAVDAVKSDHPSCTIQTLLEFGTAHKLIFVTPLPTNIELRSGKFEQVNGVIFASPKLLVVESDTCATILRDGKVKLGRFPRGHGYNVGPYEISPLALPFGGSDPRYQWETFCDDKPCEIEISVDDLYVVQSNLANLVLNEPGPWGAENESLSAEGQPSSDDNNIESTTKPLSAQKNGVADHEERPATISEREVMRRLGRSRSAIVSYQKVNHDSYDPTFPKKQKVPGSRHRIEYIAEDIDRWARAHPRPE